MMERILADLEQRNIIGVHLITAAEAFLPAFYERFRFQKEKRVILMGKDLS